MMSKVDLRHLWADDRVVFTHLLGKYGAVVVSRTDCAFLRILSLTRIAARRERTRILAAPKLLTSSIFKAGINLAGICQNITDAVRGYGIQTAAKGVELDQIQIFLSLDIICRCIESGVVHPLI